MSLLRPLVDNRTVDGDNAGCCASHDSRLMRKPILRVLSVKDLKELPPKGGPGWERGGRALRSSASRNGPFGLCQAEAFGNSFLARIIHEHFCCNRRSAATTSLRPAGSPLGPSPYCTSTHRVLTAPRAGLATRLSDFATNRHEYCGLDSVSFRLPSWHSLDGRPVPPANCAPGSATPQRKSTTKNKKVTGRLQACHLNASPCSVSYCVTLYLT